MFNLIFVIQNFFLHHLVNLINHFVFMLNIFPLKHFWDFFMQKNSIKDGMNENMKEVFLIMSFIFDRSFSIQ